MGRTVTVVRDLRGLVAEETVATVEVDRSEVDEPADVVHMAFETIDQGIMPGEYELRCGDAQRRVHVDAETVTAVRHGGETL